MPRVSLDPDHLDALARELGDYRGRLEDLLQQAGALGAGGDVAPLAGAPGWAARTGPDLRARAHLVRRTERLRPAPARWRRTAAVQAAAAPGPVPPLVAVQVDALGRFDRLTEPGPYERLPGEGLEDWVVRVLGVVAAEHVPLPAAALEAVVDELLTYADVLAAAGTGAWAASGWARMLLARRLLTVGANGLTDLPLLRALAPSLDDLADLPVLRGLAGRVGTLDDLRLARAAKWAADQGTPRVPGNLPRWALGPLEKLVGIPPGLLVSTLEGQALGEVNRRVRALSALLGTGAIDPAEVRRLSRLPALAGVPLETVDALATVPRGATNLVSVARHQGLSGALRTAGTLRVGGVVLQAGMTAVDVHDLAHTDHAEAWEQDRAGLVSDYAELGFNASLTAAMVAPNPVTLTVAGVAGAVYVGTEVWDHWDEIHEWAAGGCPGRAVEAVGDAASDLAGDVAGGARDLAQGAAGAAADVVGDGLDTLKASRLNPLSWG